jgi:hypothetical protein
MPNPLSLGVKALDWDGSSWTETAHAMFPSAVREALRRGATGFDLALLRHKYLIWVRHFT